MAWLRFTTEFPANLHREARRAAEVARELVLRGVAVPTTFMVASSRTYGYAWSVHGRNGLLVTPFVEIFLPMGVTYPVAFGDVFGSNGENGDQINETLFDASEVVAFLLGHEYRHVWQDRVCSRYATAMDKNRCEDDADMAGLMTLWEFRK